MKRSFSLKRNKEFRYVYKTGKSVACKSVVLVYRKTRKPGLHVGFSVNKRIGKSVVRNRVKRRMRAAFSLHYTDVAQSYSLIFIAREPILNETFADLEKAMLQLMSKAGIFALNDSTKSVESVK